MLAVGFACLTLSFNQTLNPKPYRGAWGNMATIMVDHTGIITEGFRGAQEFSLCRAQKVCTCSYMLTYMHI